MSALPLGGCSGLGDSFASPAFVDPTRYDLYDCERLKTTRAGLVTEAESKQKLIDKARTGTGGAFIGEAVYRSDYTSARAHIKNIDDLWARNGCDAVTPPAAPATAAPLVATPGKQMSATKPR